MGAWWLLPLLLQGVCGQQLFSVEPQSQNVRLGDKVTLECVTREEFRLCAWKLDVPGLGVDGFITSSIPNGLGFTARDKNSTTDCSIQINSVEEKHNGEYICSPYLPRGQIDSIPAEVFIARKPSAVVFVGKAAGLSELSVPADSPVEVSCEAQEARPRARLAWYVDETRLDQGVSEEETVNPDTQMVTTRSTLRHQFSKVDHGASLRCVAEHDGYTEQDDREVAVTIDVQYVPYRAEGNDIGTIYGFKAGQEGHVTVNFTSNPEPTRFFWKVGNISVAVGSSSLDQRFTSGALETLDEGRGLYALTLTIDPVKPEDQDVPFALNVENPQGVNTIKFAVATGPAPPPEEGLSGGALAGIIIAVIIVVLVIILVAFLRSQGKCCFAAKSYEGGETLVTKKKTVDVESAADKEETKELTKPDAGEEAGQQRPPGRKEGEVVYAELVLNSDGVKTEVRPAPEKTEYAVIVGTKEDGGKPDDTDKKE